MDRHYTLSRIAIEFQAWLNKSFQGMYSILAVGVVQKVAGTWRWISEEQTSVCCWLS